MATLVWDDVGERLYQAGVDHGVLYLQDGRSMVWNGLTEVERSSDSELKTSYLDGVKYLEILVPGDFKGKIKAITYPEEFDYVTGVSTLFTGLHFFDQPSKSFNMSYRTKIGNDIDGLEHGYQIHILYNIVAQPDPRSFASVDEAIQPTEFSWTLTGVPPKTEKIRPTVHISINSLTTPPDTLKILENKLYGTASSDGSLPTIQEVAEYFGYVGALIIIDHGDGTWSAIDESDNYVTMLDDTIFQIANGDATYLNATTYTISSTNVDNGL